MNFRARITHIPIVVFLVSPKDEGNKKEDGPDERELIYSQGHTTQVGSAERKKLVKELIRYGGDAVVPKPRSRTDVGLQLPESLAISCAGWRIWKVKSSTMWAAKVGKHRYREKSKNKLAKLCCRIDPKTSEWRILLVVPYCYYNWLDSSVS